MSYTNYGYYGLDNDINALVHYNTKGSKWYAHDPRKVQQSLSKYAHGANTKGVTVIEKKAIEANKAKASVNAQVGINDLKRGNLKGAVSKFGTAAKSELEAGRLAAKAYGRAGLEIASRKLAGAAAKVLGAGLDTIGRVVSGAKRTAKAIRKFGKNPIKTIREKARAFGDAISGAYRNVRSKIKRTMIKSSANKNLASTATNVLKKNNTSPISTQKANIITTANNNLSSNAANILKRNRR